MEETSPAKKEKAPDTESGFRGIVTAVRSNQLRARRKSAASDEATRN
jgi:hypothetical protein